MSIFNKIEAVFKVLQENSRQMDAERAKRDAEFYVIATCVQESNGNIIAYNPQGEQIFCLGNSGKLVGWTSTTMTLQRYDSSITEVYDTHGVFKFSR